MSASIALGNGSGILNSQPLTQAVPRTIRARDLGGAPRVAAATGFGIGGGAGVNANGADADRSQGQVSIRVGLNPAASGVIALQFPAPSLILDFMSPGTLDPRITFTRASTGTYFDSTGTMQTAAVNQPRWDYDPVTLQLRGLLLEDARTNLLLNSATLVTQSVITTAVPTTLSFYGTGTITKSGTATGALVGTGAQRVTQTFTPTAGTLTLTVTGTVTNAQLEAGAFPTSYIPTTAAAVTRAYDSCFIPSANMSPWFGSPGGSWFAEFINNVPTPIALTSPRVIGIHDVTGITPLWVSTGLNLGSYDGVTVAVSGVVTVGAITKGASNWAPGNGRVCRNGGAIVSAAQNTGFAALSAAGIGILSGNPGVTNETMSGYIRRVSYWPRILSDAEMQQVTT